MELKRAAADGDAPRAWAAGDACMAEGIHPALALAIMRRHALESILRQLVERGRVFLLELSQL